MPKFASALHQLKFFRRRVRGFPDVDLLVQRGLRMGEGAYIASGAFIDPDFAFLISIGKQTVVGPRVILLAHDASMRKLAGYTKVSRITIGDFVFVGAGSIILPGVTVGDGSIIGAGTVVRSDVDAGSVVVGNPGVVIDTADGYVGRHETRIDNWLDLVRAEGLDPDIDLRPGSEAFDAARSRLIDLVDGNDSGYVR